MEKIEYFPGFGGAYLCLQVPAVQKAHSTAAPAKRPGLHQVWCLFLSFLSQILYFILLQDLVLEFPFCFSKGLIVHSKTNASLPWLKLNHFASTHIFKNHFLSVHVLVSSPMWSFEIVYEQLSPLSCKATWLFIPVLCTCGPNLLLEYIELVKNFVWVFL